MTHWKLELVRRLSFLLPFKGGKEQDKWVIFEVLPLKRGGFFVDLAAADGVDTSNTYVLEKTFAWSGICIEANPHLFKTLRKKRNCIIEDAAISDRVEDVRSEHFRRVARKFLPQIITAVLGNGTGRLGRRPAGQDRENDER